MRARGGRVHRRGRGLVGARGAGLEGGGELDQHDLGGATAGPRAVQPRQRATVDALSRLTAADRVAWQAHIRRRLPGGHAGATCGRCAPGYYKTLSLAGGSCSACPADAPVWTAVAAAPATMRRPEMDVWVAGSGEGVWATYQPFAVGSTYGASAAVLGALVLVLLLECGSALRIAASKTTATTSTTKTSRSSAARPAGE